MPHYRYGTPAVPKSKLEELRSDLELARFYKTNAEMAYDAGNHNLAGVVQTYARDVCNLEFQIEQLEQCNENRN